MIIDADKKVEKEKKERKGAYQSSENPEHFQNEGDEFLNRQKRTDDNNDIQENLNYDKIKGISNGDKSKENK